MPAFAPRLARSLLVPLLACSSLVVAVPARAEDAPRVGIGVGLTTLDGTSAPQGAPAPLRIMVPIAVSPSLRIEPFLGAFVLNRGDTGTERRDLGVGLFYVAPLAPTFLLTVGPRLAISNAKTEEPDGFGGNVDVWTTDFRIGAALGGEYLPHPRLSVGVEAEIGYTALAARKARGVTFSDSGSLVSTVATVFVRAFLF